MAADWWLDDDQIASLYRGAADRVEQVKILGQLCGATRKEVLQKLFEIGSIDGQKYEEMLTAFSNRRKMPPQVLEVLTELYKSGYSDAAIAEIVGKPTSSISSWRRRMGFKANNPALSADGVWYYQTYTRED